MKTVNFAMKAVGAVGAFFLFAGATPVRLGPLQVPENGSTLLLLAIALAALIGLRRKFAK